MPEFDLTYAPGVNEIVLVNDHLIYSGQRTPIEGTSHQPHFSYAFYDVKSGEVWARRICTDGPSIWVFCPQPWPWLLIPYEELQGNFPLQLAHFILEGKLNDPEFLSHSRIEGTPDGGFRLRKDPLHPDLD